MHGNAIEIRDRGYWFKIVEFLQHNWALIDDDPPGEGCIVFFFGDTSVIFDRMRFFSRQEAELALRRNDFRLYDTDERAKDFIAKPEPPFWEGSHPNGPIYSSGRFWK